MLSNISTVKIVQQNPRAYQEDLALLWNFSCVSSTAEEFSVVSLNLYSLVKAQEFASILLGALNLKMNSEFITGEKTKPREDKLVSSSYRVSHWQMNTEHGTPDLQYLSKSSITIVLKLV